MASLSVSGLVALVTSLVMSSAMSMGTESAPSDSGRGARAAGRAAQAEPPGDEGTAGATDEPPAILAEASSAGGDAEDWMTRGALVVMRPLQSGLNAMRVSGGFALAVPFVGFEYARGLGGHADLGVHYEAVLGLLHFLELNLRWAPIEAGAWRFGAKLGAAYSFFGLQSDSLNLTSTLFLTPELAASVRVSRISELVIGVGLELDLIEWVVLDGDEAADGMFRVDAALARFGWKTRLADELDVYVMGRVRFPRQAFDVEDETFTVVPFAEFGGTWSW